MLTNTETFSESPPDMCFIYFTLWGMTFDLGNHLLTVNRRAQKVCFDSWALMFGHKNVPLSSQECHVGCVISEVIGGTKLPIYVCLHLLQVRLSPFGCVMSPSL